MKLEKQIAWWKDHLNKNNSTLDNNPSPGNKKGGLTTILEKSLGGVAKSGTRNLVDVLDYGEKLRIKGFADAGYIDPIPYKQDLTEFWEEHKCKPYPINEVFSDRYGTRGP